MNKRTRFLIIIAVLAVCFAVLWPSIKWYFLTSEAEQTLALGSRDKIREYARTMASNDYDELFTLANSNSDEELPAEFSFLIKEAKEKNSENGRENPAKWNAAAILKSFTVVGSNLEQTKALSKSSLADTLESHYRTEILNALPIWLVAHSGKRKNLEVDFFGGEPLMNFPVIKEVVAYGRSLEEPNNKLFKFTTTTNAVAMTDEIMDFLNKEMDNVVISIDGRKEVHDRMRPTPNGKGSYDLIMDKAKRFAQKRGQKRYYLRGTYTRYNLDFASDVLHLADEGFEQLSIEPVVTDPKHDYAIREEDLPRVYKEYERLGRAYVDYRKNGKWFNFFHFMVDLSGGPCLKKRLTGCGSGNEYVAVTANGDIYPCHQFVGREGMRMGSVLDGTFDTSIQKQFQRNHVLAKEKCSKCWARFYCSGGCAANAHAFNGDIGKPYDMECKLEQKRLECALAIYAIENEEG